MEVIIATPDFVTAASFYEADQQFWSDRGEYHERHYWDVTYWQPLPSHPTDIREGGETATPRTDAECRRVVLIEGVPVEGPLTTTVSADFARQLERELSAAKAALASARGNERRWEALIGCETTDILEAVLHTHDAHSLRANLEALTDAALQAAEEGRG